MKTTEVCAYSRWAQKRISRSDSEYRTALRSAAPERRKPQPVREVELHLFDGRIYHEHEEFSESRIEVGYESGAEEVSAHATAIADLIVGRQLGIAPHARLISNRLIMDRQFPAEKFAYAVERSLERANEFSDRARIALLPWVSPYPKLERPIEKLLEANFAVICGAGNHHENSDEVFPCRIAEVITVGGTNFYDGVFWETRTGSGFGKNIDIMAPAKYIMAADIKAASAYRFHHGTSFSAALVAGVAACHLSECESATTASGELRRFFSDTGIRNALKAPADKKDAWPDLLLHNPYGLCGNDVSADWVELAQLLHVPLPAKNESI